MNLIIQLRKWDATCFHEGGETETITKIQVFWDVMSCCLVNCYWHWSHNETSHVYHSKFCVKTEQIIAEKCKIRIISVFWEESAGNFFLSPQWTLRSGRHYQSLCSSHVVHSAVLSPAVKETSCISSTRTLNSLNHYRNKFRKKNCH